MRRVLLGFTALCVALSLAPARAQCTGAAAPDRRLVASACATNGTATYTLGAGAYGLRGRVAAGPDGLAVDNVPFVADRVTFGPGGPGLDQMEIAGPTPIDSSLGNGGLTAGFTPTGTIAVLSWPNPSYFNQMKYLTLSRGDPRLGAAGNMGAFAGLDVRGARGKREFSWLRDWPATQRYLSGISNALVTTFRRGRVIVKQVAVVSTRTDAMTIRYRVTGAADPKIVFFENLDPANHKIPFLPGHDQYLWEANDLAAVWQAPLLTHFRYDVDPGKLLNVVEGTENPNGTLASDLYELQHPGVAFAISSMPAPSAHQIGVDGAGLVREGAAVDAYEDASTRGAALSGSDAALGQVDAAIAVPVRNGVADVIVAAGHTTGEAGRLARATRFDATFAEEEAYWRKWLSHAELPARSANLDVDRRALIAIANATSKHSRAIVASIARQTPYAQDWTRDGAFLNYALDLAGQHDMVTAHNDFYARIQRANGTWGTMYYADGEEGGPFLYESDQQGLAVWTLWQHYVMYPSNFYLDDVYPAIVRAANWLTSYSQPNGRQGYGSEDDNFAPSDGLQGAITQWLGLTCAVRMAMHYKFRDFAERWSARAAVLKRVMLDRYWDSRGRFVPGFGGYGQGFRYEGDPNSAAWVIWPAGLLDPRVPSERAKLASLAAYLYDYLVEQFRSAPALIYDQKVIQALAVYLGAGFKLPGGREPANVRRWVDFYHTEVPTPTLHFGEQIWRMPDGSWADRIDMPHVWSGALVYLDAISLTRPELTPYRPWLR